MYAVRQEFENHEIEIESKDFNQFRSEYLKATSELDQCILKNPYQKSRIFMKIYFNSKEDFEMKERVVKALGPVFEIALDRTLDKEDLSYLITYKDKSFYFKSYDNYFEFSLGDSNEGRVALSMISIVYAILYSEDNLKKYNEKFLLINDSIIEGGFNSASFNGLQGYYFSNYFVKWLLDLRHHATKSQFVKETDFEGLFSLIENLENPKDDLNFTLN